jgi:hypothetical protein
MSSYFFPNRSNLSSLSSLKDKLIRSEQKNLEEKRNELKKLKSDLTWAEVGNMGNNTILNSFYDTEARSEQEIKLRDFRRNPDNSNIGCTNIDQSFFEQSDLYKHPVFNDEDGTGGTLQVRCYSLNALYRWLFKLNNNTFPDTLEKISMFQQREIYLLAIVKASAKKVEELREKVTNLEENIRSKQRILNESSVTGILGGQRVKRVRRSKSRNFKRSRTRKLKSYSRNSRNRSRK